MIEPTRILCLDLGPSFVGDTGRWFGGPDGKSLSALDTVRIIDARHERGRHFFASPGSIRSPAR